MPSESSKQSQELMLNMKPTLILIIALVGFGAAEPSVVGQKTSVSCLPVIDRLFSRVPNEEFIFYEVNRNYFLRAEILKNCQLSKINVDPKYSWAYLNADWKEPGYRVTLGG